MEKEDKESVFRKKTKLFGVKSIELNQTYNCCDKFFVKPAPGFC